MYVVVVVEKRPKGERERACSIDANDLMALHFAFAKNYYDYVDSSTSFGLFPSRLVPLHKETLFFHQTSKIKRGFYSHKVGCFKDTDCKAIDLVCCAKFWCFLPGGALS